MDAEIVRKMKMWRPRIREVYERFRDCFEEAGLLHDLIEILNYMNEALIIIEGYGGGLHLALLRTFVLENLEWIDDFARADAQYVGATTMKALCDELKEVLKGGDVE